VGAGEPAALTQSTITLSNTWGKEEGVVGRHLSFGEGSKKGASWLSSGKKKRRHPSSDLFPCREGKTYLGEPSHTLGMKKKETARSDIWGGEKKRKKLGPHA